MPRDRSLNLCIIGPALATHVQNRAKALVRRGHRVCVVSEEHATIPGVEVTTINNQMVHQRFGRPLMIHAYQKAVQDCRPDIVHVHYAYGYGPWMAALLVNHPLVVSLWGGDILFKEQPGSHTPFGRRLTSGLLESADVVTAPSNYIMTILRNRFGSRVNTRLVRWGIDLERFKPAESSTIRARLGLAPTDRVLFSPKILARFYNLHLVIDALPAILSKHPDVKLLSTLYFPDPDYKAQLHDQIHMLGLERHVLFASDITYEDMPLYYNLAEIAVSVIPSDGMPLAMLEAMGCGVPNVLARLPIYEELVSHQQSAYFVDISSQSIAEGIMNLLDDQRIRETISRNALQIARAEGDIESEIDQVEEIYSGLLARPVRQRSLRKRAKILRWLAMPDVM